LTLVPAEMKFYMNGAYTWDGFYDPNIINAAPTNWKSPVNYYNGSIYLRYEVLEKPSDKQVALQLCVWQDSFGKESCGRVMLYTKKDIYYVKMGGPSTWWNKSGGAIDWTRKMQKTSFMHKNEGYAGSLLADNACGAACYKGTDLYDHIPIKYHISAYLVSAGGSFTQPPIWPDCPTEWGCVKQTGIDKNDDQLTVDSRQAPLTATLSPNPVTDMAIITIKGPKLGNYVFTLVDNNGNLVKEVSSVQKVFYWDGKDREGQQVKPGFYIYTVTDGAASVTGKILKTN
jgi:hypothetical protein